jgi:hypothetical protein
MTTKKILIIFLIFFSAINYQSFAQGDLLITPKRVVFEGNKQRETLNLVNIGADTATFSISFVQYNMAENGSFITIDTPDSGQMFADPYLRIFPRTVTLAPGEPQVIMMQYRRRADMLAGEYRSHLYFRSESNYKALGQENSLSDSTLLSVQLIPVYGISIPIIIRNGEVEMKVTISDLELETQQDGSQILKLALNRTGNISVYGNIQIEYIPTQGRSFEIGGIKGVGVYTNINKRNISVRLNNTTENRLTNGMLKVTYISNDGSKKIEYAQFEFAIGN